MEEPDDKPDCSAEQQAWVELAQAVRSQLAKAVALFPAMKPDEQKAFVETCKEAVWFQQAAETHDREVELKNNRVAFSD